MNYSTFLHSGLVNPAKPKIAEAAEDSVDSVALDIPLLTRLLELAREDIKSDEQLHHVISNLIDLKNQGVLNMDHYDQIVQAKTADADDQALESMKKLAGI
jgi:hypothetical protein